MADRKDVRRICDETTASDNGPPAGGKRRLIREGGSASWVIMFGPGTQGGGGGIVSTVSARRTLFDDVSLAVEQSGEEPQLVSSGCSTVWADYAHIRALCGCRMIGCL